MFGFAANEFASTLSRCIVDSSLMCSVGLGGGRISAAIAIRYTVLFADQIYTGVGSNLSTTIMAAVAIVSRVAFLGFRQRLRSGRFANFSAEVNGQ